MLFRSPEIIRASGTEPIIRILSAVEYRRALHEKLAEEAQELLDSGPDSELEELADVYEVFLALVAERNYDVSEVLEAAEAKRAARGGFVDRIFLTARD